MVETEQRRIKYAIGYSEVKPGTSENVAVDTHNDLLRLARFGKQSIYEQDTKTVILFHAVGKYRDLLYIYYLLTHSVFSVQE